MEELETVLVVPVVAVTAAAEPCFGSLLPPGKEKRGVDFIPVSTPERLGVGIPGIEKAEVGMRGAAAAAEVEEGALLLPPITPPPDCSPDCATCSRPGCDCGSLSAPGSTALTDPPANIPAEEDEVSISLGFLADGEPVASRERMMSTPCGGGGMFPRTRGTGGCPGDGEESFPGSA